ncbi:MAG: hypothetical protein JWM86_2560 [Thermoleophilia bacterium]|nr:hypothetical protein [Thermoleophilia bacterium]
MNVGSIRRLVEDFPKTTGIGLTVGALTLGTLVSRSGRAPGDQAKPGNMVRGEGATLVAGIAVRLLVKGPLASIGTGMIGTSLFAGAVDLSRGRQLLSPGDDG